MTEVLISSSALILAVCLLRFLLQNRISMKIRYGLWGLAALRLILPMFYPLQKLTDVFRSRFSVMNAAQTVRQNMIAQTDLKYLADNVATGLSPWPKGQRALTGSFGSWWYGLWERWSWGHG